MKATGVRKWLENHGFIEDGFLTIDFDGPTEIAINGQNWELSFEGRTDEVVHRGVGLDPLLKLLNETYNAGIKG